MYFKKEYTLLPLNAWQAGDYPQFPSGTPWPSAAMQVKGDDITDLMEDMDAERKHFCHNTT